MCIRDRDIANNLGVRPKEFVRKNEAEFKNNNLAGKLEKDDELFEAMSKFPKIMERPIIISDLGAVIGRPPENVLKMIANQVEINRTLPE